MGAWIVMLSPLAYAAVATFFILFPPDSTISSSTLTRLTYELTQFIALGIIFLLTVVFYVWGQLEKRNQDVVVELNVAEGTE